MKIAAITMTRKDDFWFGYWIRHYEKLLGRENLHVFLDGDDWETAHDLSGMNVEIVPAEIGTRRKDDRRTSNTRQEHAKELLHSKACDFAILTDCDELVTKDPTDPASFEDRVSEADEFGVVYTLGLDIWHNRKLDPPLQAGAPILSARRHAYLWPVLSKPQVIGPIAAEKNFRFALGCHSVFGAERAKLSPSLLNFHIGMCDYDAYIKKMKERLIDSPDGSYDFVKGRLVWMEALEARTPETDYDRVISDYKYRLTFRGKKNIDRLKHQMVKNDKINNLPYVRIDDRMTDLLPG